ncbi:MAG: protein-L-isoaspartate O-methyltransferase family protein [Caulobacteraceae bacterium]
MALDYAAARTNMVENQVRTNDVTDLPIQDAMRVVPRERFCPPGKAYLAYAEAPIAYAPGYFLMEPRDVSKLLQAIYPREGQKALAIAAPYAAAVLGRMGVEVTLLMPQGAPYQAAAAALEGEKVTVIAGNLADELPGGPYDVIVCEAAVPRAPASWISAIAMGGRLGVVERDGPVGKACLYFRGEDAIAARREVFDSSPHMLAGFEPASSFSF